MSISDLVVGVNIALGNQPPAACPAFQNSQGRVDIAQLVKGVNNALNGCPSTPTATGTEPVATPTSTPEATSTSSATVTAPPTATATNSAPPTSSPTVTATITGAPTDTATVTAGPSETPSSSPSATPTETPTAGPTSTPTTIIPCQENDDCALGDVCVEGFCVQATPTATPTDTAEVSPTPTQTIPPSATPTVTETVTPSATPTETPTATPSRTPTQTPIPAGQAVAGRAAIVASGLGSVQSLVGAVVTAITNQGSATLVVGGVPPTNQCPISGQTSRDCTVGPPMNQTLHLVLGAVDCVTDGPAAGTAEFDGTITLDAPANLLNSCDPVIFLSAAFSAPDLTVVFRDAAAQVALNVSANLNGNVDLTPIFIPPVPTCPISQLILSLTGPLTSQLPEGEGVTVTFQSTQVKMDDISFNDACVPIAYRLTFNGTASFSPLPTGSLQEVGSTLVSGVPPPNDQDFSVTFANFVLEEDASADPVSVEMSGNLSSSCIGGTIGLSTFDPITVFAGQICPSGGGITVNKAGQMTTVTYDDGMVTVTPPGMLPVNYPSCLDAALLTCG